MEYPAALRIADFNLAEEVENLLAQARDTAALASTGERLAAARAAVDLVKAYDRVLEHIRLASLSLPEQQRVRDRLSPVALLLRKYRLR